MLKKSKQAGKDKTLENDTQAVSSRPSNSNQEALSRDGEGKKGKFFSCIELSLTQGSFPTIPTSQHHPLDSLFPGNKADNQSCWLQGWIGRAAISSASPGRLYTNHFIRHGPSADIAFLRCSSLSFFYV